MQLGDYAVLVAIMMLLACQRAGIFSLARNSRTLRDVRVTASTALRTASLAMIFPENYSAFGLAAKQQPAKWFVSLALIVRLMPFGVLACRVWWERQVTPVQILDGLWGMAGNVWMSDFAVYLESFRTAPFTEQMNILVVGVLVCFISAPLYGGAVLLFCSFIWPSAAKDIFGVAEKNIDLQERAAREARKLSNHFVARGGQASWKERSSVCMSIFFYIMDFFLDANCAMQLWNIELYVFFTLQLVVIFTALLVQSRLLRRQGGWKALGQGLCDSWQFGLPADTLLLVTVREKTVEAPLSFLLQSCAFYHMYTEKMRRADGVGVDQREAETLELTSFAVSMIFSLYGMTSAAYVHMHLDVGHHLEALEASLSQLPDSQSNDLAPVMPEEIIQGPALSPSLVGLPAKELADPWVADLNMGPLPAAAAEPEPARKLSCTMPPLPPSTSADPTHPPTSMSHALAVSNASGAPEFGSIQVEFRRGLPKE